MGGARDGGPEARARAAGSRGASARRGSVARAEPPLSCSSASLPEPFVSPPELGAGEYPTRVPVPAARPPTGGLGRIPGAGAADGPGSLGAGSGAAASPSSPPGPSGPRLAGLEQLSARLAAEIELPVLNWGRFPPFWTRRVGVK